MEVPLGEYTIDDFIGEFFMLYDKIPAKYKNLFSLLLTRVATIQYNTGNFSMRRYC
jgi:hypothetical protein